MLSAFSVRFEQSSSPVEKTVEKLGAAFSTSRLGRLDASLEANGWRREGR